MNILHFNQLFLKIKNICYRITTKWKKKKQGTWEKENLKICEEREAPISILQGFIISCPVAIQQVFYLLQGPVFVHCSTRTFILVVRVIVEVGRNTSVGMHWSAFELLVCDFGDCQLQSVMRGSYCPSSDWNLDMQEAYLCLHSRKVTTWRNVIPVYILALLVS